MTPNFKKEELACKCGCGFLPKPDFIEKIQHLRERYGRAMPVTSAARCSDHNAKVSGTGRSGPHTTGRAIDIAVSGGDAIELIRLALVLGFTGIGVNQKGSGRFIHLDDLPSGINRPRPYLWSY